MLRSLLLSLCAVPLLACSSDTSEAGNGDDAQKSLPALGNGSHSLDDVELTVIGTADDGLSRPLDLAFNPGTPGEVWVVNRRTEAVVRYQNIGTDQQTSEERRDPAASHFMSRVSSISFAKDAKFGNGNTFGTCQESDNGGNDFMGPTLWTSDWEIFGFPNPEAVALHGNLGSHIDMMHESPLCMGIGWEQGNAYWTVDGTSGTISRYDFMDDHDVGHDDHSVGHVMRYVDAEYLRVENVPSHIVYDHAQQVLFYNDTGNSRVLRFDPKTAEHSRDLRSKDSATFHRMGGGSLEVVADASAGLVHPSGLALRDGVLYVTDAETSRVSAFRVDEPKASGEYQGTLVDYLDTNLPAGALAGLEVDESGAIWLVDAADNQLWRLRGK